MYREKIESKKIEKLPDNRCFWILRKNSNRPLVVFPANDDEIKEIRLGIHLINEELKSKKLLNNFFIGFMMFSCMMSSPIVIGSLISFLKIIFGFGLIIHMILFVILLGLFVILLGLFVILLSYINYIICFKNLDKIKYKIKDVFETKAFARSNYLFITDDFFSKTKWLSGELIYKMNTKIATIQDIDNWVENLDV